MTTTINNLRHVSGRQSVLFMLLLAGVVTLVMILTSSCTNCSRSSQLTKMNHTEKVVIIDSKYVIGSATSGNK